MRKPFFLALFIIIMACNNFKDTNKPPKERLGNKDEEIEVVDKELEVIMEFKTNKDAEIVFMLNNIKVDEFQTKNIHLFEKVIATTTSDQITGKFGPNNISRKMTISLGKKELKEFEILSIRFKYGNGIVNILPKDLNKYFGFSKFSLLDTISNKIKTVKVGNAHNPKLYVKGKLWNELKVNL